MTEGASLPGRKCARLPKGKTRSPFQLTESQPFGREGSDWRPPLASQRRSHQRFGPCRCLGKICRTHDLPRFHVEN